MNDNNDKGKQFYDFVVSKGIKVPDTYDEFSQKMQDTATAKQFHGFVSKKGIKVPEINSFMSAFASQDSSVPEKKNLVESSSQDGSQGLQDGQAPLSTEPQSKPPSIFQLPQVEEIIDFDPQKDSVKQNPKKIEEQFQKQAVEQAGIKPGEYKNSVFNAAKMKDLGEIELELYKIDGKAVSSETLRDRLFDQDWVQEAKEGKHSIEINPSQNPQLGQFIDPEITMLAERNLQSGTAMGDKWDMLSSGAYRAASGVTGINSIMASTFEEVTGLPFTKNMDVAASKQLSEDLIRKASEQEEKTFQYKDGFVESIMKGNYADAWQQGMNATAASIPYSAMAGATTYAAGPAAAFAVLAPMSASSEFADMNISEDEAYAELSNAEKLSRSYAIGTFEAGADLVAGRALTRSFDLSKSFWKGMVKEAYQKGGEEAARKSAEEISRNIVKRHLGNIGMQGTEEYIAEGSSQIAQMLTDDLMGIREYSLADYLRNGNEAGLIGAFSGVTMTSITGAPTVIASKGIDANNKIRSYFDKRLRKDPELVVSEVDAAIENGAISSEDARTVKDNVESRGKAVNSVPEEMSEDTETIDLVQKKQELEKKKSELDPIFQGAVQEEIDAVSEEISGKQPQKEEPTKEETLPKGYEPPLTFTSPTDEKYAVMNRGDGKGDVVITKKEYDSEIARLKDVESAKKSKKKAKKEAVPPVSETTPPITPPTESKIEQPAIIDSEGKVKQGPTETFASKFDNTEDVSDVVEGGTKITVGDTDITLVDKGNNVVEVNKVRTPEDKRGKGSAKNALATLTEKADEEGITLELNVAPEEEAVTTEGLEKLYSEAGFEKADGNVMRRKPNRGVVEVKSFKKGEGGTAGILVSKDGKLYKSAVPHRKDIVKGKVEIVPIEEKETQEYKFLSENQDMKHLPKVGEMVETSQGKAFEIEKLNEVEEGSLTLDEINQIQETITELNNRGVEVADNNTVMRRNNGDIVLVDLSAAQSRNKNDIEETVSRNVVELLSKNDQTKYLANQQSKQIIEELTLFDETPKPKTEFAYLLTQRPPSIGTHPDGQIRDAEEITLEDGKRKAYKITYDKPLSVEDIKRYELTEDITMNDVGRQFKKISGKTLIVKVITNVSDKGVEVTTFLNGKSKSETHSRRKFQREIDGYSEMSKPKQDAIQEQKTEGVDVREQTGTRQEVGEEVQEQEEVAKEEKVTQEQLRQRITELVQEAEQAENDFDVNRVAEINAEIDELSKQIEEEDFDQDFTEEEAQQAIEQEEAAIAEEAKGKDYFQEIEQSFSPISVEEYESYKGKGAYKENRKFLSGLVTKDGSQQPIDTRQKEDVTDEVEFFDPEKIIEYVDAVASERAEKGFTERKIPKKKTTRKSAPKKREITANKLREAAKRLREGKPGADGRLLADPTLITPLIAAGMESAAKLMESGANLLESEIVDHIVEFVRKHKNFKKLSATQRKALDLRKYVLDEMGMTYPEYVESLIKANKKKERAAKTEGKKEARAQEKLKEQKKKIKEEILERGQVPNKYTRETASVYEELSKDTDEMADERLSGIMNELVPEDERGKFQSEKVGVKETLERGKALVDNGTLIPEMIVSEILDKPRPMTAEEIAAMVYYKAKLDSLVDALVSKIDAARANRDYGLVSILEAQLSEADGKISLYHQFQEASGYEQGRSLRMRQLLINREYELANQVRLLLKETGRKNMPKEAMDKFRLYDEAVKELNKRLERYEKAIEEGEGRIEILSQKGTKKPTKKQRADDLAKKLRKAKFTKSVSDLSKLQSDPTGLFKGAWDGAIEVLATTIQAGGLVAEAIDKAVAHLKKSDWYKQLSQEGKYKAETMARKALAEQVFGEEDVKMPEMLDDGTIYVPDSFVRFLIQEGHDTIEKATAETVRILKEDFGVDVTERQARDAISDYGKRSEMKKDDISKRLREIKRLGKLMSALEDVRNKKRPMRSGIQRDKMTKKERELKQQINALLKEIPQTSEEIENEWKSALDAIKQRLKNRIEDLNEQIATGKKTQPKKTVELDAEAKYLKEEVNRLKDILKSIEGKPELSFEERVKITESAIQRSINEYQRRIAEEDFSPLKKDPVSTPKIESLKEKRAKLREEYNKLAFNPDKEQQKRDAAALKRIQNEIDKVQKQIEGEISLESKKEAKAELPEHVKSAKKILESLREELKQTEQYQEYAQKKKLDFIKKTAKRTTERYKERIKNKDFAVKEPVKTELDQEAKELRIEQQRWKNKFELEREKWKLDSRSDFDKRVDALVDLGGLSKSLVATADVSAMGRQGALLGVSHPILWSRAITGMFKQAFSEEAYERWMDEVVITEEYAVAKKYGLYIATPSARLTAKEEDFVSGMAQKIPIYGKVVRASERAYSAHLNILRMETFTQFYNNMRDIGLEEEREPEVFTAMSKWINNATGRGKVSIGKEDAAPDKFMSFMLFSPRFLASRINIIANTATGYAFYPKEVRKEALKSVIAYATILSGIMALAALGGAEVEEDPRSVDFGKIRWNGFTYDIAAGFLQVIRIVTLITGHIAKFFGLIDKNVKITRSGIKKELNKAGWKQRTLGDEVWQFFRMKFAPAPSAMADFAAAESGKRTTYNVFGQEFEGKVFFKNAIGEDQTITQRALQMTTPIWTHDIQDVYQEKGAYMTPPAVLPDIFGFGTQYIGEKTESELLRERNRTKREKKEELNEMLDEIVHEQKKDTIVSPVDISKIKVKTKNGAEISFGKRLSNLTDSIIGVGNSPKSGGEYKEALEPIARRHNVKAVIKSQPAKISNMVINSNRTGFKSGESIAAEYIDAFPNRTKISQQHLSLFEKILDRNEFNKLKSYFQESKSKNK